MVALAQHAFGHAAECARRVVFGSGGVGSGGVEEGRWHFPTVVIAA